GGQSENDPPDDQDQPVRCPSGKASVEQIQIDETAQDRPGQHNQNEVLRRTLPYEIEKRRLDRSRQNAFEHAADDKANERHTGEKVGWNFAARAAEKQERPDRADQQKPDVPGAPRPRRTAAIGKERKRRREKNRTGEHAD